MAVLVQEPTRAEAALFDQVDELLRTMRWPVKRPAAEGAHWSTGDKSRGSVVVGAREIRAFALGKVRRYDLPRQLVDSQYNAKFPELHALLRRLMRLHDPSFRYNAIQLNAGVQTKPHYDRNNTGLSYCLALGKYTGGGIDLYDDDDERPARTVRNKRKWVLYDGVRTKHGSAPVHSGVRYAIIYYHTTPKSRSPARRSASPRRRRSA